MDADEIVLESRTRSSAELCRDVDGLALAGVEFAVRRPPFSFRATDPAIVVALVGAGGSTLTALVAGLLQLRGGRRRDRITVELASGSKVEVPADIPPERLREVVATLDSAPNKIILP